MHQPQLHQGTERDRLDALLTGLSERKHVWSQLEFATRIRYLQDALVRVRAIAPAWVAAACQAKGIDPQSPLAGEEWLVGPVVVTRTLRLLIEALQAQGQPQPPRLNQRPDGQAVAQVLPNGLMEQVLYPGMRAEVWLEPGKPPTQGMAYRQPAPGRVALVLGAGNVTSIGPLDLLSMLFGQKQVVLLKLNPINQYMGPFLEQAFQSLCQDGFLQIVAGDGAIGSYLCQHPLVDTIHITGSHHTHDRIVWGDTPEIQQRQKALGQPLLQKPITSELGCVTPVVILPGRWSRADLVYQARQLASMVANNASFNCAAAKVVVTAQGWPQRQDFLTHLQQELQAIAPRQAYYPGAQERYQAFLDRYPQAIALSSRTETVVPWTLIPDVPAQTDEYALTQEAFCGVLAEVALEGADTAAFLANAVGFVNQQVWGNLSCTVIVDPQTARRHAAELDRAIADLRYGAIGINGWSALAYSFGVTPWGAFPGNPLEAIASGRGMVHNTYLFDYPQKTVVWVPFRLSPTPAWFANHRTLLPLAQRLLELEANPTWGQLPGLLATALRG